MQEGREQEWERGSQIQLHLHRACALKNPWGSGRCRQ